jgi:uncharacterized protein (DUF2147 family)
LSYRLLLAALLLAILPVTFLALADNPNAPNTSTDPAAGEWLESTPSPTGRWVTPSHDAVIQISPCGNYLCGTIVGIVLNPGDPVPTDWQGKSQCGLTIIHVTRDRGAGGGQVWTGTITDPRDGSVYNARIRQGDPGSLLLRGYLGIPLLGKTQTWSKYSGPAATHDCRLSG